MASITKEKILSLFKMYLEPCTLNELLAIIKKKYPGENASKEQIDTILKECVASQDLECDEGYFYSMSAAIAALEYKSDVDMSSIEDDLDPDWQCEPEALDSDELPNDDGDEGEVNDKDEKEKKD